MFCITLVLISIVKVTRCDARHFALQLASSIKNGYLTKRILYSERISGQQDACAPRKESYLMTQDQAEYIEAEAFDTRFRTAFSLPIVV